MKKYIVIFAASLLALASCDKQFDVRVSNELTGSKAIDIVAENPGFLASYVNGFYSWMIEYNGGGGSHQDFGHLSVVFTTDLMCQDIAICGSWNWGTFDINHDTSSFEEYLKRFGGKSKGDKIYNYMAMAALYNHDYEGAVAAYDNIDELDEGMKSNYMKAYFMRANQLIGNGAWRDAVPCLKAAAYYSPRQNPFNQLSRFWLAESLYHDEKYSESRNILTDLYNLSALDGKAEGYIIPYDIAYTFFKEGDYMSAHRTQ